MEAPAKSLCAHALDKLQQYDWPGNLRELENIVQRAMLRAPHHTIHSTHVEVEETQAFDEPLRLFTLPAMRA